MMFEQVFESDSSRKQILGNVLRILFYSIMQMNVVCIDKNRLTGNSNEYTQHTINFIGDRKDMPIVSFICWRFEYRGQTWFFIH